MGTPTTIVYAAAAAFAAGIGATVALTNFGAGGTSSLSKAPEASVRSDPSPKVDRPWSNPPQANAASTPASPKSRPALSFDDAAAKERVASAPTKSADVPATEAQARHERVGPLRTIDGEVRKAHAESMTLEKASPPQTRIDLTPSMRARVDTIRAERAAMQRARLDQSRTAGIENRAVGIAPSVETQTRTLQLRRSPVVEQDLPRERAAPRLAAKPPTSDRQSLAADKDVRDIVTPTRGLKYADSQRIEPREPRKRVSSADTGGVMKWLMQTNGNF